MSLGIHNIALKRNQEKIVVPGIFDETLEMRVGTTLARQMTDAQLDEFESFINSNDEAGALRWLETNFPNYKDVVAQEFDVLKGEIRQAAPQIVASAAARQQQMMQQQPMQAPAQDFQQQPQAMPQQPYYGQPQAAPQQPVAPIQPQQPSSDQSQFGQAA